MKYHIQNPEKGNFAGIAGVPELRTRKSEMRRWADFFFRFCYFVFYSCCQRRILISVPYYLPPAPDSPFTLAWVVVTSMAWPSNWPVGVTCSSDRTVGAMSMMSGEGVWTRRFEKKIP